tara:strand:- start:21 stop:320 length:300 start_codon:yes stop_codon:yes gene_type:complete
LVDKNYEGPILAVAIYNKLKRGRYKITINLNNKEKISKSIFDYDISQWGKKFSKNENFTFTLERDVNARKQKAIWINIFKNIKTDTDISIRSLTITRIK